MERKQLTPKKVIDVEGKISYAENFQSWNMLRLRREIIEEFPVLKEKRSSFSYRLMFCRNYKELMDMIKGLKGDSVMPLILWMYKES